MSTSRNDITGDPITTKTSTDAYRDGWDKIFGKKAIEEKPKDKKKEKQEVKRNTNNL